MSVRFCILFAYLTVYGLCAVGQSTQIDTLIGRINHIRNLLPVEKLYLQLDKPAYLPLDTIWFKAYLLDADYLHPSPRSGLLYLELDDVNNKSVKRLMVPVASGLSWGNIILDESVPEGSYTLRAYTNWMLNFGEDYIFKKNLYIAAPTVQTRLVAVAFKKTTPANVEKDHISAEILITGLNKQPLRLRDMQLEVMEGRRELLKSNATTGVDGKMEINFDLPKNIGVKDISIVAKDVTKEPDNNAPALTIPLIGNLSGSIDLQFMPEGGRLIAGIPANIAFKAIGEDGKGIDISGKIYDSKQREAAVFKSDHGGMGCFTLEPGRDEQYVAKVNLPDGRVMNFPLPPAAISGTALKIENESTGDSVLVCVSLSPDLLMNGPPPAYYVIGQSRGVVCYAAKLTMKRHALSIWVPKSLFPTGIAHFTLLTAGYIPLNERICFINHHDNLQVNVMPDKNYYSPHDSIALKIKVTDKTNHPVQGNFSMAVVDDNQVSSDLPGVNITNELLLTSDLKGTVEEPGYYFENKDPGRSAQLDNLMLTQGWRI